ncbi:TetR/AcrR family transcriptional regulator [Paenibacillus dakarensis]|uniref:TetR/AcrR family transcriptional regulator n=1 Tax=Paenibacillus dakarensis TaxID=1527293 RepID=UPI0006D56E01|nr:TetR/AcrR family transcriptional regulator [Paenibacillus dakarensis]
MSSTNIMQAALVHFARDGYEGASLKNIADDCGIKKPSIYAHFASKGDLFMQVLKGVFQRQEDKISRYFEAHASDPLEETLRGLLVERQREYHEDQEAKFLLRMSFFPPHALHDEVMGLLYPFLDQQEDYLASLFAAGCPVKGHIIQHPRQAALAYITLLDGIDVEILYGGEARSARRLEQAWPVYWAGVTSQE